MLLANYAVPAGGNRRGMVDKVNILIVDDEPGIREVIEEYLKLHGFRVAPDEDANEGRPRTDEGTTDLLVLDLTTPDQDGLTLTRWLRDRGEVGFVKVHTVLRHPTLSFRPTRSPARWSSGGISQDRRAITRKIAAIMAADVASYSRLVAEDEEETLRVLAAYREIFEDFVDRYGGRIFNIAGDSVMSEFSSAVEAMRAAIDIQEAVRTHNLAHPPNRWLQFRIGITIADVVERRGELLGDGVNLAARLESLAEPGGICISRSVHESVANKVSVIFRDLGEREVKNIPTPVHAFVVDWPDPAPPSRT
jgi:class 3 adenylate cyclase